MRLEIKKRTLEPKQKSDAGSYPQKVKGYSLSAIETYEKRRKKDLEKSTSHTRSIKDIFLAQHNRNRLHHQGFLSTFLLLSFQLENSPHWIVKKMKSKFQLQIQAVHYLGKPLHLKEG